MENLNYVMPSGDTDFMYIDDQELQGFAEELGRVARKDPREAKRLMSRVKLINHGDGVALAYRTPETRNMTGKALMERRLHLLSADVRDALRKGNMTIADYSVYAVKDGGDKNAFEVLSTSMSKAVGVTNISNAKLPANMFFLIMSISLLEAQYDSSNQTYGSFALLGDNAREGEWTLKVGNKPVIDSAPTELFYLPNAKGLTGEFRLEKPILVAPQTELVFAIDLKENTKSKFKLILRGVATV